MLIIQPTAATVPGKHENLLLSTRTAGEFRTGQLLEATILSNSRDGVVQLRIGTTELTAHTNVPLPKHAHIELKVMQLQPHLVLKILPTTEAAAQISQTAVRKSLHQAILTLLPKQTSSLPALNTISQSVIAKALTAELPTLQPLIRQVMNALPTRKDMSQAGGIRQAILQSGIFFEARVAAQAANNQYPQAPDIKALIARLLAGYQRAVPQQSTGPATSTSSAQELVPAAPPLRGSVPAVHHHAPVSRVLASAEMQAEIALLPRRLEGALSRISLLQIATADNFDDGQMLWQLEIPVRRGDSVELVALTIERDQHGSEDAEDESWAVNLALDLPQLGPLHIHVNLNHEGLHSSFRTHTHAVLELIESRLATLHTSLEKQGLTVQSLNLRTESSSSDNTVSKTPPLIDEQV